MKFIMKNIFIVFLGVILIFTSNSCDEALDINTNPLAATAADPNAVLPYVIVQYSNRKITELGTRTMDVPQYLSNCFNSPKNGATTSFLTGNTWNMYYTQVLGNLTLVEKDAKETGITTNNVAAIAIILKALSFYELSSIWGDVPFSEALNGQEFPFPNFDKQQDVFNGVLSQLDEAISLIDNMPTDGTNFDVSVGDLVYGGDMDKWKQFANSLKLRVLMLIRNVDTSVDTKINQVLAETLIETNGDIALVRYTDSPGQQNAWQQLVTAFFGGTNEESGVYAASPVFYDLLNDKNDPRFGLFIFDPNSDGPAPVGVHGFSGNYAYISNNIIRNDFCDIWFTPSEISLFKAELALKGVITGDPQVFFEEGITNSLEFWGKNIPGGITKLTDVEISDFVATLPDLNALSNADALKEVYENQYIDGFMRPIVAWNHVRRTNVPSLSAPPAATISTILKRFDYPPNEIGSNPNTPANPATDTKMWFEN